MKKFFEKHDLFKLVGIFMLITVILSWLVKTSIYTDGTLTSEEITRLGLFDVTTYSLLGFYYFTGMFMFILVVSGFYKFLGSLEAYQIMTDKIANKLAGKEKIVVAVSTFLFAVLASIISDYYALLILIPFVIAILSKMRVDKVTGLIATFGGVLIGILSATYSSKLLAHMVASEGGMGITYANEIVGVLIIGIIAYVLLTYFTLNRMKKVDKADVLEDPFAMEEEVKTKTSKKSKVSIIPLACIFAVTVIVFLMAFVSWSSAFNVTVFTDLHKWITEATLFGENIYSYILGASIGELGSWDFIMASGFLFIMSFILKLVYHVTYDKLLDSYISGVKKISKTVMLLLFIYTILILNAIGPTIPAIVDVIMKLGNNVFTLFVSGLLTNLFTVESQFTYQLVGSLYANFSDAKIAALVLQSSFGVFGFLAPTSAVLMLGLSMLDIKFKDYFKFIWKFLLALIIVVLAVLAILMYI